MSDLTREEEAELHDEAASPWFGPQADRDFWAPYDEPEERRFAHLEGPPAGGYDVPCVMCGALLWVRDGQVSDAACRSCRDEW